MKKIAQTLTLTNENIDLVVFEIEEILHREKFASRDIIRTRLKAEEMMHFYQARFGEEHTFTFLFISGLSKRFTFLFEGEKTEPFAADEDDEYLDDILHTLGKEYYWQYKHRTNVVDFFVPKKPFSQLAQIGIAVACVILFTLLTLLMPSGAAEVLSEKVFSPLTDTLISILKSGASLFIFISITLSIVNIGDVHAFKKVSRKLFSRLFAFLFVSVILSSFAFLPWITFAADTGAKLGSTATELFSTLLEMIPTNPIQPFINGNSVQIIFLSIFSGVILSLLGETVNALKLFLHDCNTFFVCAMEKLTGLMPFLVFLVLQNTILSQSVTEILAYRTIVLLWGIGIAVQFVLPLIASCIFGRMSPLRYFKSAKSPLLISLLTSSSVAALPYNLDMCKKDFGVNETFLKFSLPIVQVMLMPCSAVALVATCVSVAHLEGMAISLTWIVMALLISVFLSVATPPIPGSAMLIYSLLFTQMNLPANYIGIALALGALTDCLVTTSNIMSLHSLLLWTSRDEA